MRVQPFADLLKQWIAAADQPAIAAVRTNAEVGLWEAPVGVRVTLGDGWSFVFQTVGGAPVGATTSAASTPAPEFWVAWADRPDYKTARAAAEEAAAKVQPAPRGAKPRMGVSEVMALLVDAAKRADDERLAAVEVTKHGSLQVTFGDGSTAWTFPAGVMAPGALKFVHPLHEIPEEYR